MRGKLRLSLQYKLFLAFVLGIILPITLVSFFTTQNLSRQFQVRNMDRIRSIVGQMARSYQQYGTAAVMKINKAAKAREISSIVFSLSESPEFSSIYETLSPEQITESAKQVADPLDLDVFTILASDGSIISSSHYPEKFGIKNQNLVTIAMRNEDHPFLISEETPTDNILTIQATRRISLDASGAKSLILSGGYRLFRDDFLERIRSYGEDASLLFYDAAKDTLTSKSPDPNSVLFTNSSDLKRLAQQIRDVRDNLLIPNGARSGAPAPQMEISLRNLRYMFTGIPLIDANGECLGVLLIGLSQKHIYAFLRDMNIFATVATAIGIVAAILLSALFAMRVTQPVKALSRAVRSIAAGNLDQTISVTSQDEIGMLSAAFNKMALDLKDNREKLIQIERVAAWREMARRLAHELKNPLFPIQVSVETMIKAEQRGSPEFPTIFSEGTITILEEINSLKSIIKEFSEFARMPKPVFGPTSLNQVVKQTLMLFNNQLKTVRLVTDLDDHLPLIMADKEQLGRLIKNLVANALDAMPGDGTLTLQTRMGTYKAPPPAGGAPSMEGNGAPIEVISGDGEDLSSRPDEPWVILKIADTGEGISEEAKQRLFTPYFTTKPKGTGLGLAIVQSIVADHNGKISVESVVGQGTTFEIDLPVSQRRRSDGDIPS